MVITVCNLFAVCCDMRLHPCDITDEETHHIERVGAKDNHILTATAVILLTAGVDGLDRANLPFVKHLFDGMRCGEVDRLMRYSNL